MGFNKEIADIKKSGDKEMALNKIIENNAIGLGKESGENEMGLNKDNTDIKRYEAIVVGVGHAGIEAGLALARTGKRVLITSITLDNVGYLACNPSIGGTAKGHLVREVDALGGEMGIAADKTLTQLRMLNSSKGAAVHSLRAQVDKYKYHEYMKQLLETEDNVTLRQAEIKTLNIENGKVVGITTVYGQTFLADAVVIACGVYLESTIIVGDVIEEKGPVCFNRANHLAKSLKANGVELRRFKTGTPARVKRSTVDLEKLEKQEGEEILYSFSFMSDKTDFNKQPCYLGYTNEATHDIIRNNLDLSPKYSGLIHGTGARYCPSIEDKIVRFKDKTRHQFFLEPEGEGTEEMYVQGLSTSLPSDVQEEMYRSVVGFERVEIMRDAYAIEYECIDPMQLDATLRFKGVKGLYFAGQINGTSGYEEAAAQGLVAGINASLYLSGKSPMILTRDNSYIGVMIDDLINQGTSEPYRMMTSRAEFRLVLRQDNADLRLTEIGKEVGLVKENRFNRFLERKDNIEKYSEKLSVMLKPKELEPLFNEIGAEIAGSSLSVEEIIRRSEINEKNFTKYQNVFEGCDKATLFHIFTTVKYAGYLEREKKAAKELKKLENMPLSGETDYTKEDGLRIEAREKLNKIKPLSIGQASRIEGVTPADVNVLILKFAKSKKA